MTPDDTSLDPPVLKELQTRFLHPFYFQPGTVERASALLHGLSLAGKADVWRCGEPDDLYEEEALPHVSEFLFPRRTDAASCNYLRVENDALNRIFQRGLVLELPAGVNSANKLTVQRTGIEVFLNEHGVGVLSLNLQPDGERFTPTDAIAFNYRLVQPRRKYKAGLRLPHPVYEPEQFKEMPERERLKPPPEDDAPITDRLGVRGGRFWLSELAEVLLQPLTAIGFHPALRCDLVQAQFWVYSVARFDESVDMGEKRARQALSPFLSALAQVEEPGHAGAVEDDLSVSNAILNTKHWSAVGLMGAVHLIADQPNNHDFNGARPHRAFRKYFMPYLMGLLQRLVLQRAMDEASRLVKTPQAAVSLSALRQSLLEFGASGHFGQVSSRHAVQRFFAVAEEGLGVDVAWQDVRQVITDLDSKFNSEQMLKLSTETKALAERQKQAVEELLHLQSAIHWIEVFIVSVYSAELWNIFASELQSLHRYVPMGIVVFAVAGLVGALLVLKPWKHKLK